MTKNKEINKDENEKEIVNEKEEEMKDNQTSNDSENEEQVNDQEDTKDEKEIEEDKETFETKYLRMVADFQNYKKRSEKEKSDVYTYANEKFGTDLLEVLDNFERAIEQDKTDKANEPFLQGMEMILKQLKDVLKKNGIEEIEALGTEFDPNFHHAVAMESSDKYDKGCVTDVMQKGYKLKDRVIRPSMVRVAE